MRGGRGEDEGRMSKPGLVLLVGAILCPEQALVPQETEAQMMPDPGTVLPVSLEH